MRERVRNREDEGEEGEAGGEEEAEGEKGEGKFLNFLFVYRCD